MASAMYNKTVKEILDTIPDVKMDFKDKGYSTFETPIFRIRVIDEKEEVKVHLAVKESFDRWANSVDFAMTRTKKQNCFYPIILPDYQWAIKVLETGLFNFNKYFATITLPHLETEKNT